MKHNISNIDEFTMGMDGDVINYDAVSATQNIGGKYGQFAEDLTIGDDDDFYGSDGDYSNAWGSGLYKNFKKNQAIRQKRRDEKSKSKNKAREGKADAKKETAKAKQMSAKAQQESAKASQEGVKADVAMAEALKSTAPPPEEEPKKGLSLGVKIGIGVGAAVVLGVIGFVIYKSMKAKKG